MVTGNFLVDTTHNAMDFVLSLNVELEGSGVRVEFKRVQKKNTSTNILIPGLPRGFCQEGIEFTLRTNLKKCEKDLCLHGKLKMKWYDEPLPVFKAYFRQSRGYASNSADVREKYSLNNLKEYRKNGCTMLHVETDPGDYARMGTL